MKYHIGQNGPLLAGCRLSLQDPCWRSLLILPVVLNFSSSPLRESPGFWVRWVLGGHQETVYQERRYQQ